MKTGNTIEEIAGSLKDFAKQTLFQGGIAALWLLLIPREPSNAVFLGYSLKRLALLIPIGILPVIVFLLLRSVGGNLTVRDALFGISNRNRTAKWIVGIGFGLALAIWSFMFFYFFLRLIDDIGTYFRLLPVMLFYLVFSLRMMAFVPRIMFSKTKKKKAKRLSLRNPVFLTALVVLLIIFGIIEFSGLGKDPLWVSTSTLAVPLLEGQIWYSIGILLLIAVGLSSSAAIPGGSEGKKNKHRDWLIFFGIWALAVLLWMVLPLPDHNYFAPSVRPPTHLKYPFSDAEQYDFNSLYLLFGSIEDFAISKPLYVSFLSVLHLIGGFDYRMIVFLQTLVVAFLPAVGYLIGKEVHSRVAGIGIGLLMIMREMLSIQASSIANVSNSKLLMSDVPATLVMAVIVLVMLRWFKEGNKTVSYRVFLLGGLTAMLNLMRIQTMALIPFMVLVVIIRLWGDWRKAAQGIGLIVLTIGILLTPILVRNHAITGVYWLDNPVTSTGVSHFVTVGTDVDVDTSLLDDEEAIINRNFTVLFSALTENFGQMVHFISDHYLRNIISTALIIPVRLGNGVPWIDLFRMRDPFWAEVYTEPNLINSIVLIVNSTIISLGFAALWKRKPILPLMLLLSYLVYNLSSSLVRLSGWRFVQPVDWFLYIFFISGVVEIIGWCYSKIPGFQPSINLPYWYIPDNSLLFEGTIRGKVIISGLLFFLACGFIPFRETLFPKYIPEYEKYTVCDEVSSYILGSEYQEWDEKMTEFCKSSNATVYKGFGFYPRFFDEGEGYYDRSRDKFYGEQDYSRLVFRIVGELNGKIYIKTEKPATGFSDGDLVYAIVENENRVGAHVVVIPGARPEVIIASDILSVERPFITNK